MKHIYFALACFMAPLFGWGQYGILDTTFNEVGYNLFGQQAGNSYCHSVLPQTDGGIIVTRSAVFANGVSRYLPDGTMDLPFANGGGSYIPCANSGVNCLMQQQQDGRLLLVGQGASPQANTIRFTRFLPDGQFDLSFGPEGQVTNEFDGAGALVVAGFKILDDGRMLVAGTATADVKRMFLARFLADGTPDVTFSSTGYRQYDVLNKSVAYDMEVRPDGRVLLAGYAQAGDTSQLALLQLSAEGIPDATFGSIGIITTDLGFQEHQLKAISLGPDGSILGCGFVRTAADDTETLMVRYSDTGVLDPSFATDGWSTKDFGLGSDVYSDVLIEDDGMILVTGATQFNERPRLTLERYFPDGSAETSFATNGSMVMEFPNSHYGSQGIRMALDADGKVLVVGYYSAGLYAAGFLARFTGGMAMSVTEVSSFAKVPAYPNPTSGTLQLDLPSIQKEWDVRFMDTNGRMVKQERLSGSDGAVFDVRDLSPGAYQVVLQAGGEQYRATFVKMP